MVNRGNRRRTAKGRVPVAAAVYVRISDDRVGAGLGVGRQEEDCRRVAAARGWQVHALYADNDVSAYSGKPRPAYRRMLDDLADGTADGLVIWHPDRLHRSIAELEDFIDLVEEVGCQVATVQAGEYDLTTASGRAYARMGAVFARMESEHQSERAARKHLEHAREGRPAGGGRRPFGFADDRVSHHPAEAAAVRDAAARLLDGEPLSRLVATWRAQPVPTVGNGTWSMYGVKRMLTSSRVAGRRRHPGLPEDDFSVEYPAVWEPILVEPTVTRLRELLWAPQRTQPGRRPPRRNTLAGVAVCGLCGTGLTLQLRSRGRSAVYRCPPTTAPSTPGCGRIGILQPPIDDAVRGMVLGALGGGGLARTVRRLSAGDEDAASAAEDLATAGSRLHAAEVKWGMGELSPAAWADVRDRLTRDADGARRRLSRDQGARALSSLPTTRRALADLWDCWGVVEKNALLRVLLRVRVMPAPPGQNRSSPELALGRMEPEWLV